MLNNRTLAKKLLFSTFSGCCYSIRIMDQKAFQVLLFYKYVDISAPDELATRVQEIASELSLTGRVIVAKEGINATLEGLIENTEEFVAQFFSDQQFMDVQVKRSRGTGK